MFTCLHIKFNVCVCVHIHVPMGTAYQSTRAKVYTLIAGKGRVQDRRISLSQGHESTLILRGCEPAVCPCG